MYDVKMALQGSAAGDRATPGNSATRGEAADRKMTASVISSSIMLLQLQLRLYLTICEL